MSSAVEIRISRHQIVMATTVGFLVLTALGAATYFLQDGSAFTSCKPGTTITVSSEELRPYDPRVWGDWVSWVKSNPRTTSIPDADVMAYQISTGRTVALATGPHLQSVPRIHEQNLVWREEPTDGYPRMVLHNLTTGEAQTFEAQPRFLNVVPRSIYGSIVVFHADAEDQNLTGLYAFNFDAGTLTHIPNASSSNGHVEIWGTTIAYTYHASFEADPQLGLYHLGNGTRDILIQSPRNIGRLDFHGHRIALERPNETFEQDMDIYLFDINTRRETPIATGQPNRPIGERLPRMGEDTIAYMEDPPVVRLMAYRISTGDRVEVHRGAVDPDHDHWDNRSVVLDFEDNEDGTETHPWKVMLACV